MPDRPARAARLLEAAERVHGMRERLASALVSRGLRVHALARREVEVAGRRLLALAGAGDRVADRRPLGTVALMLPSNAALSAPLTVIGAALLAGNRVLIRLPRRNAWLAGLYEEILAPFGPAVTVTDVPGPQFLERQIRPGGADATMIFGDDRWAEGYEGLARRSPGKVIFEGPGKDPFLVLPGADLDDAAAAAVRGGFYNGGQACTSPERVYVHASLAEGLLARLLARVEVLVPGPAADPRSDYGPVRNPELATRFVAQVEDAVALGARLLWPPRAERLVREAPGGGALLAPVLLAGADHTMTIMREETFGPALPVCTVASAEEAAALAEDSAYGLTASVFGDAAAVTPRLRRSHGLVFEDELWLDFYGREPLGPVGGFKRSGWVWEWQGGAFVRREGPREMLLELSRGAGPSERQDEGAAGR